MKKELIQLGYIIDLQHNRWDAYCESKTFTGTGESLDVVCEGITLENEDGLTLLCESLSHMQDRFSQRQIAALTSWILEQERNDQIAYAIDNAYDQRRECE